MYACVLIPRELSLVLSLHPNHTHVLEMSAAVWSNTHLSPGTIFYPDEGEVRLDRIESRIAIPDEDIRRFYGCYDAVLNINGQEVRHCNWVRFVKSTTDPDDANIISSKVRGQSFYQVIRAIKPNEEIRVWFHLNLDRTLYDRPASFPYPSYSPSMGLPQSYIETSFGSQTQDIKPTVMTSTPLPTKSVNRHTFAEDLRSQKRLLNFGSSSSSSSLASAQFETPSNDGCQRNNPRESSFTSPMYSSSSSRETSSSDKHSKHSTTDASFLKESSPTCDTSPDRGTSIQTEDVKDVKNKVCLEENQEETVHTYDDEDDPPGEPDVDVVSETNPDGSEDDCDDLDSIASGADNEDAARCSDVSRISERHTDNPGPLSPRVSPPQPTEPSPDHTVYSSNPTPHVQEQSKQSLHLGTTSEHVQHREVLFTESQKSDTQTCNKLPTLIEDTPCAAAVAEHQMQSLRTQYQDISSDEKDNFSSPNETRAFSYMLPPSPRSVRALDLHQTEALDNKHLLDLHQTEALDNLHLKRCRERTWWPCAVCGKKFDRPSLLKRHTRTHTGEKPHACDVCGKAFSTSSSLNTHKRIHSGEKPHQCKICGKRFTASSNLYYHRMTHNKEKPHKCDLCAKSFPTPGDLRSHMYIHNGSWPFRCDVCNRGFSKQTNLKNHMLLHSGNKPHECSRCGKKFALLCNLRTHIKTHENSDLSDCVECLKCGSAMDISDDHETICKSCTSDSHETSSKPLPLKKRPTDFSISRLTLPDVKETDVKPRSLPTPLGVSHLHMQTMGLVNSAPAFLNSQQIPSHHLQMSAIYRQFFPAASDHQRWLLPPSSQLLSPQFLPGMMKHPMTFQGSPKTEHHQHSVPSVAHSGVPLFVAPNILSLQGGSVFPAVGNSPGSFSMHHGSATLGGHVMTQGF